MDTHKNLLDAGLVLDKQRSMRIEHWIQLVDDALSDTEVGLEAVIGMSAGGNVDDNGRITAILFLLLSRLRLARFYVSSAQDIEVKSSGDKKDGLAPLEGNPK